MSGGFPTLVKLLWGEDELLSRAFKRGFETMCEFLPGTRHVRELLEGKNSGVCSVYHSPICSVSCSQIRSPRNGTYFFEVTKHRFQRVSMHLWEISWVWLLVMDAVFVMIIRIVGWNVSRG